MDKIRIPVSKKIGPEFQCLEGWGENSNVYKKGRNSKVWKDKIRISICIKIGPGFQSMEG